MRKHETVAEKKLWSVLSGKSVGEKFRRQHPISFFVADFYCHRLKLVIEVDGKVHSNSEQHEWDEGRTAELEKLELKVIRVDNEDVLQNLAPVIQYLQEQLKLRAMECLPPNRPHPLPPTP